MSQLRVYKPPACPANGSSHHSTPIPLTQYIPVDLNILLYLLLNLVKMASENAAKPEPPIGKLPADLLLEVADHLDTDSLVQLSQVCKSVHGLLLPKVHKAAREDALPPASLYAKRFVPVSRPNGTTILQMKQWRSSMAPREKIIDAIRQNRINIVSNYLEAGVDPNSFCFYGSRMLNVAIRNVKVEIVDMLLSYGADPSLANPICSITPLSQAVRVGERTRGNLLVKMLIQAGADLTPMGTIHPIVRHCTLTTIISAASSGADLRQIDSEGMTTLHCVGKDQAKLTFLLDRVPDLLGVQNRMGETALFPAIRSGCEDTAMAFFNAYRDLRPEALNVTSKNWETALHLAIRARMKTLSTKLIETGVALDKPGRWGMALHYAVKYEMVSVVQLLIEAGVDVNVGNGQFTTPLHLAVQVGSLELVKMLVRAGARLRVVNRARVSPLELALLTDKTDIELYLRSVTVENHWLVNLHG